MTARVLTGDCRTVLASLDAESVQTCVSSPPYFWHRDYGVSGQIGLEPTPDAYVAELVAVFRAVRRVLRDDGTLWLNLGDSYVAAPRGNREGDLSTSSLTNPERQDKLWGKHKYRDQVREPRINRFDGLAAKQLIGIPWRVAFALQADGWYLRSDIIWSKPNPMPESVTDRPTKAHEYLFLLAKSPTYYYDADAIAEDTVGAEANDFVRPERISHGAGSSRPYLSSGKRNRRTVWTVTTAPFADAHFATFPPKLIEPCILAGSKRGDVVLDPFGGAGTTGLVADRLGRDAVLIELNPAYAEMARRRITDDAPLFADGAA